MENPKQIIDELEYIIQKNLLDIDIPLVKGNVIRIRHLIIRMKKDGEWIVIDSKENKTITALFSKIGAVAFAKAYLACIDTKVVERFDKQIEKEYNDSLFYVNTIKKTTDLNKKEVLQCRFNISRQKIDYARTVLDNFIMEQIR